MVGRTAGVPSAIEQVCRRIDLQAPLVIAALRVASNQHHRRIGEEQRVGMIEARKDVGSRGTERVRNRVVQIGVQARRDRILVVSRSAGRQHFSVRQDGRVHLDPRLGHRRSELPLRRGRGQVDDFRGRRGRVAASEDHHARPVAVRRRQGEQDGRAIGSRAGVVGRRHDAPTTFSWTD